MDTTKIDLLQEYKEQYYKEIEHSERLNGKINTMITFLTILGGAQVLLWTQMKDFEAEWYLGIYICFSFASLILFIISSFEFYKAYSGYEYRYFPIKSMALTSIETYKCLPDKNDEQLREMADEHIYNMYCERFLNDAIANRNSNTEKNNKHKKLIKWICFSLIITMITYAVGVGIDYYETKTKEINIEENYREGDVKDGGRRDQIDHDKYYKWFYK